MKEKNVTGGEMTVRRKRTRWRRKEDDEARNEQERKQESYKEGREERDGVRIRRGEEERGDWKSKSRKRRPTGGGEDREKAMKDGRIEDRGVEGGSKGGRR